MGKQFPDLPSWEFTTKEVMPGLYLVVATRDGGISAEFRGPNPEAALDDLRTWAHSIEKDLQTQSGDT